MAAWYNVAEFTMGEVSVVALSDERKKQIRAEEEARLKAEREAEQQYREQVRRELEQQQAGPEQQTAAPPLPDEPAVDSPPPRAARPEPIRRKHASRPLLPRIAAVVLIVGGLTCAGLAVSRGFALPFVGPREIKLEMTASGEPESLGKAPAADVSDSEIAPAAGADIPFHDCTDS